MSAAERTAQRLLLAYPRSWRARYGDELAGLIVDMSGKGRVPWRMRADVAWSGARERMRGTGGDPSQRARGGAIAVMWAWAVFILAGVVVAKTSEHWQQIVPGAHAARAAFVLLIAGAVIAGGLVLVGLALAMPSFVAQLRSGGWARVATPIVTAATLTVILLAAGAALTAWAGGIGANARNGGDPGYSAAFVACAVLAAATLLTWTAAATRAARGLTLSAPTIRAQTWLAAAVTVAMVAMTAATTVWYVVVANAQPAALVGGTTTRPASAFVAQLIVAMVAMVAASGLATSGVRRAVSALPELG